jgi:hypothetical protein
MRGKTPFFMSKCASKDINDVKNVRKLYVFGQIVVVATGLEPVAPAM